MSFRHRRLVLRSSCFKNIAFICSTTKYACLRLKIETTYDSVGTMLSKRQLIIISTVQSSVLSSSSSYGIFFSYSISLLPLPLKLMLLLSAYCCSFLLLSQYLSIPFLEENERSHPASEFFRYFFVAFLCSDSPFVALKISVCLPYVAFAVELKKEKNTLSYLTIYRYTNIEYVKRIPYSRWIGDMVLYKAWSSFLSL